MKFKIDENLPAEIVDLLTENGYEAKTVYQQTLQGKPDSTISEVCREENRVLISLDIDFADIKTYPPQNFNGIIVLKVRNQSKKNVMKIMKQIIPFYKSEPIQKHLWIVEENRIRIRE